MRSLKFRAGVKVSQFVTELRSTIAELYGIQDDKAMDLIAINHATTMFDEEVRDQVRVLQLSGTATLENILELAEAKKHFHE